MISMVEIEQMSRDAYERGKRDGVAEERERVARMRASDEGGNH